MKKLIKTSFVASLSLFLFNCSSDDSTAIIEGPCPGPEPIETEKTYYLSAIEQKYYSNSTNKTQPPTIEEDISYLFFYDDDFTLQNALFKNELYENGQISSTFSLDILHSFNEEKRLKLIEFSTNSTLMSSYLYNYDQELVKEVVSTYGGQGSFTGLYSYNDNKQMISYVAPNPEIFVDYTYNNLNQIDGFKLNGVNHKFEYDDKKSPFFNLPYDLTSIIMSFDLTFPYTYKFSNNITSFKKGNDTFFLEHTYNEADLPIRSIKYAGTKENNRVIFDITYSYIIREVEVKK